MVRILQCTILSEGAQTAFMSEPRFQKNHRGNILNAMYTEVGIGIAQGPDGSLYITQDFVTIPAARVSQARNLNE